VTPEAELSSEVELSAVERDALTLAAIVESSDDAIVSKDLNGIITSWNPAAVRIFGWEAEEAIGRSIKLIIPPERHHEEDQVLARIRAGLPVDHFETVRVRKDGSTIDISLTVSPVRDYNGRIVGASKIARDISARRAAEEAIRQSQEIKDQFLSLVSHELRTPIAIIVGNGHLLSRRGDSLSPEDHQQALADITSEGERLQRIIENLLMLTRVESGDRISFEHIQVERIVEEVIARQRRRSEGRTIAFECSESLPPAMGEQTLVTQVIENLVSNADKYSPEAESIEVRASLNESGEVEVHVLDRGIGLSDSDLSSLFQPFYRAESAKERASGMGLGLAVCRKAIEAQGGSISALPRPGGGSDFWFTLPIGAEAQFA
jgi:PAS domain S-box-containing protein